MEDASAGRWNKLRELLKDRLSEQAFATWVSQMSVVEDGGTKLTLGLPNVFALDWVNNHYRDRLTPKDLGDPQLYEDNKVALDRLTTILKVGPIYSFQQQGSFPITPQPRSP